MLEEIMCFYDYIEAEALRKHLRLGFLFSIQFIKFLLCSSNCENKKFT